MVDSLSDPSSFPTLRIPGETNSESQGEKGMESRHHHAAPEKWEVPVERPVQVEPQAAAAAEPWSAGPKDTRFLMPGSYEPGAGGLTRWKGWDSGTPGDFNLAASSQHALTAETLGMGGGISPGGAGAGSGADVSAQAEHLVTSGGDGPAASPAEVGARLADKYHDPNVVGFLAELAPISEEAAAATVSAAVDAWSAASAMHGKPFLIVEKLAGGPASAERGGLVGHMGGGGHGVSLLAHTLGMPLVEPLVDNDRGVLRSIQLSGDDQPLGHYIDIRSLSACFPGAGLFPMGALHAAARQGAGGAALEGPDRGIVSVSVAVVMLVGKSWQRPADALNIAGFVGTPITQLPLFEPSVEKHLATLAARAVKHHAMLLRTAQRLVLKTSGLTAPGGQRRASCGREPCFQRLLGSGLQAGVQAVLFLEWEGIALDSEGILLGGPAGSPTHVSVAGPCCHGMDADGLGEMMDNRFDVAASCARFVPSIYSLASSFVNKFLPRPYVGVQLQAEDLLTAKQPAARKRQSQMWFSQKTYLAKMRECVQSIVAATEEKAAEQQASSVFLSTDLGVIANTPFAQLVDLPTQRAWLATLFAGVGPVALPMLAGKPVAVPPTLHGDGGKDKGDGAPSFDNAGPEERYVSACLERLDLVTLQLVDLVVLALSDVHVVYPGGERRSAAGSLAASLRRLREHGPRGTVNGALAGPCNVVLEQRGTLGQGLVNNAAAAALSVLDRPSTSAVGAAAAMRTWGLGGLEEGGDVWCATPEERDEIRQGILRGRRDRREESKGEESGEGGLGAAGPSGLVPCGAATPQRMAAVAAAHGMSFSKVFNAILSLRGGGATVAKGASASVPKCTLATPSTTSAAGAREVPLLELGGGTGAPAEGGGEIAGDANSGATEGPTPSALAQSPDGLLVFKQGGIDDEGNPRGPLLSVQIVPDALDHILTNGAGPEREPLVPVYVQLPPLVVDPVAAALVAGLRGDGSDAAAKARAEEVQRRLTMMARLQAATAQYDGFTIKAIDGHSTAQGGAPSGQPTEQGSAVARGPGAAAAHGDAASKGQAIIGVCVLVAFVVTPMKAARLVQAGQHGYAASCLPGNIFVWAAKQAAGAFQERKVTATLISGGEFRDISTAASAYSELPRSVVCMTRVYRLRMATLREARGHCSQEVKTWHRQCLKSCCVESWVRHLRILVFEAQPASVFSCIEKDGLSAGRYNEDVAEHPLIAVAVLHMGVFDITSVVGTRWHLWAKACTHPMGPQQVVCPCSLAFRSHKPIIKQPWRSSIKPQDGPAAVRGALGGTRLAGAGPLHIQAPTVAGRGPGPVQAVWGPRPAASPPPAVTTKGTAGAKGPEKSGADSRGQADQRPLAGGAPGPGQGPAGEAPPEGDDELSAVYDAERNRKYFCRRPQVVAGRLWEVSAAVIGLTFKVVLLYVKEAVLPPVQPSKEDIAAETRNPFSRSGSRFSLGGGGGGGKKLVVKDASVVSPFALPVTNVEATVMSEAAGEPQLAPLVLGTAPEEEYSTSVQVAMAVKQAAVDLGPTMVKAAQTLATRVDVVGPDMSMVLSQLQDDAPPFPSTDAIAIVEAELGKPVKELFTQGLSPTTSPVASASFGQVYRCVLAEDGSSVAVKVQRPNVLQQVALDIFLLRALFVVARTLFNVQTNLPAIADELGKGLFGELDYISEARNAEVFASANATNKPSGSAVSRVVVPRPLFQYTTRKVLTMSWITGERPTALLQVLKEGDAEAAEMARRKLLLMVRIGLQSSVSQLMETGVMHADPHLGNLLITADGKLGYLDFGLLTRVKASHRRAMLAAIVHLCNAEWRLLAEDLQLMEVLGPKTSLEAVAKACEAAFSAEITPMLSAGLSPNLSFGPVTRKLIRLALQFRMRLPPYFILIIRSLATLEGVGVTVAPGFKIFSNVYPIVLRRVCYEDSPFMRSLLQQLIFTPDRRLRWARAMSLSTVLSNFTNESAGRPPAPVSPPTLKAPASTALKKGADSASKKGGDPGKIGSALAKATTALALSPSSAAAGNSLVTPQPPLAPVAANFFNAGDADALGPRFSPVDEIVDIVLSPKGSGVRAVLQGADMALVVDDLLSEELAPLRRQFARKLAKSVETSVVSQVAAVGRQLTALVPFSPGPTEAEKREQGRRKQEKAVRKQLAESAAKSGAPPLARSVGYSLTGSVGGDMLALAQTNQALVGVATPFSAGVLGARRMAAFSVLMAKILRRLPFSLRRYFRIALALLEIAARVTAILLRRVIGAVWLLVTRTWMAINRSWQMVLRLFNKLWTGW
eukprot:jgi/Mesvir1/7440/Mv19220-RA.1